jgi:predicted phage baseplate assembly protein
VKERPTAPVSIRRGDAFATASGRDTPSVRFEYTGSAKLELAFPDKPGTDDRFTATATIPVVEGRLVTDDVLGRSDGTPYQRFALTYSGLILRSFDADEVALTVAGDDRRWTLRETLAFTVGRDPGFTVEIDDQDRAEIVFGEVVPPVDATLSASYRVGGGVQGNVPRDTITTLVDAPGLAGLVGLLIAHPRAIGGAQRESIEHAVTYAPRVFRSLGRAVTADDYVAIALSFPGVAKSQAFATRWNAVNLVVAPEGGGPVNDVLHGDLLRVFEDRRPIGTQVVVLSAEFVPIFVTAVVEVEPYYSNLRVADQVRAAVRGVLAFDRADFGSVIYLSKFYEAIEAVDGVAGVSITEFSRPGQVERVPLEGKLKVGPNQLPRVPEPDDLALHPHEQPGQLQPGGVQVLTSGGAP